MVACGVVWYISKNLASLVLNGRAVPILFIACLTTCTARSAAPFDAGWYGGVRIFLMPFCLQKVSNSVATN